MARVLYLLEPETGVENQKFSCRFERDNASVPANDKKHRNVNGADKPVVLWVGRRKHVKRIDLRLKPRLRQKFDQLR